MTTGILRQCAAIGCLGTTLSVVGFCATCYAQLPSLMRTAVREQRGAVRRRAIARARDWLEAHPHHASAGVGR